MSLTYGFNTKQNLFYSIHVYRSKFIICMRDDRTTLYLGDEFIFKLTLHERFLVPGVTIQELFDWGLYLSDIKHVCNRHFHNQL